jgi:hypothetical protein
VLRTGNVGVAGSTGTVLHRALSGLRTLIDRSLAQVRLDHDVQQPEAVGLADFIDDLAPAARLEADARGVTLNIVPVDADVAMHVDRQVLSAVVVNLLQNATKFTREGSTVTLRVRPSPERVLIEVEDECGGLPVGSMEDLFRPFEQRGADRTGMGLGLAFSRWGVEANRGRLYARNLPEHGCVFTVDMPRALLAATA